MHISGKRGRFGICCGEEKQLKTSPSLLASQGRQGTIRAHRLSRHTCDAQQTSPAFPQAHIILLLSLSCLGMLGLLAHYKRWAVSLRWHLTTICALKPLCLQHKTNPLHPISAVPPSVIIGLHILTASDPLKQNLGARLQNVLSPCPCTSRHVEEQLSCSPCTRGSQNRYLCPT